MNSPTTVSIRTILIAGFGGLTVAGIAVSLALGLTAAFQNSRELLTDLSDEIVSRMVQEIGARLDPVEAQAAWIAQRIADGQFDLRNADPNTVTTFFQSAMAATPQVAGVAWIDETGLAHQWNRDDAEPLVQDWSTIPGLMDWLNEGRDGTAPTWGPPVWQPTIDTAAIIYETMLHSPTGFLGVVAFAVPIADLSHRLSLMTPTSFVLHGDNDVLAHASMIDWRPSDAASLPSANAIYNGRSALLPLSDIGDPVLERIWSPDHERLALVKDTVNKKATAAEIGDKVFVFLYQTIDGYGPVPWHVGLYLDTDNTGMAVHRMQGALAVGIGVLAIAVIFSLMLAKALGRPIQALSNASTLVRDGRLSEVPDLPVSHVAELNGATESFKEMVAGLAERDMIRRTLGRYVPEAIAEKLLSGDGGLDPAESEATILFSDIAGFTSLTESLGPRRTVDVLNAYFSRMTAIIEAEGGVITQFQGDAILAIFNIPIEAADHAERACAAAAAMLAAVDVDRFAGEAIRCRIGLNTGPVFAGAVGAEGRLTYTVHGDAVNRAARLEAMNKEHGTQCLMSQATASQVRSVAVRKVADVAVRGQSETVTVYTFADHGHA